MRFWGLWHLEVCGREQFFCQVADEDVDSVAFVEAAVLQKFFRNLPQPLPEDRMIQICFGFADVPDSIKIRVAAVSQTGNLWKYVPNPVRLLPPVPYFLQRRRIIPLLRL